MIQEEIGLDDLSREVACRWLTDGNGLQQSANGGLVHVSQHNLSFQKGSS